MDALLAFLTADFLGKATWLWLMFIGIVIALLVFDLGVLHRDPDHVIEVKESLWLSAMYISLALAFGAWVWWYLGAQSGMEYMTGFLIEKSLALDNVFVIALIFTYFAIPQKYQHRVLFWGILGVIVLRAIMIGLGAAIVSEWSWVLWIFGAFLLITGIKMLWIIDNMPDIGTNPLLKFLKKHMRVTNELHGHRFFVTQPHPVTNKAVVWATPLFFALILVEFADLVFAVDSVPAIFAITQDPFIVYTSNIFAILGLRALYFALAAVIHRFTYLKYALAVVLIFIGCKIFYNQIYGKLDAWISLTVTFSLLAAGVLYSLWKTRGAPPVNGVPPAAGRAQAVVIKQA
ncbi:MAG: TerC family protein [Burkholderiales bacterium]|nr:TerC family protein [Burkholderiales bacterium]